jgi:hypothetical protein
MNVLYLLTTVTRTQPAPTLMDLSCVLVTVDILEMEHYAKVNKCCDYQTEAKSMSAKKLDQILKILMKHEYFSIFQDINECSLSIDNCQCINTIGSFSCRCNHGYTGNGVICYGK